MDGMSKPDPTRYRTTNWSDYNAALRKRRSVLIWLYKDMTWLAPHEGRQGGHQSFRTRRSSSACRSRVKGAAKQSSGLFSALNGQSPGLFKLPLRQTTGMVASLLKMAGLDWSVPDDMTLCRRQKTLVGQIPYRRVDGPLNLLVDSIGPKTGLSANHAPPAS